jgi:hypothetical protein
MSNMDEPDLVLRLPERLHDAVDAVAGQTEDGVHAPGDKTFHKYI